MANDIKHWLEGQPLNRFGDGTTKAWLEGQPFNAEGTAGNNISGGSGIPSAEAFGAGGEVGVQSLGGIGGIATGEAFGTGGAVSLTLEGASGIPSAEAFGADGTVAEIVGTAGIASAEAFGAGGDISRFITGVSGIASAEAFGDGSSVPAGVALVLSSGVNGIASAEAFGSGGTLYQSVGGLRGIASAEAFGNSGTVINLDTSLSPFGLYIDYENRTNYLRVNGIKIDEQLNFNSAASILLVDEENTYTPNIGEAVVVLHLPEGYTEWQRIFAGSIESITRERIPGPDRTETFYELKCVDFARALSRRRIQQKFAQADYGTLTAILTWINTNFLVPEGITWVDRGDPGITIPDIEFAGVPLNEALTTLGELTGWDWAIDYYGNFFFYDRPAYTEAAPHGITEETTGANGEVWFDLKITTDRGLYRNRQLVKSSQVSTVNSYTRDYISQLNYSNPYPVFWNGYFLYDGEWAGKISRITGVRINDVDVTFYAVPDTPPANWEWRAPTPGDLDLVINGIEGLSAYPVGTKISVDFETVSDLPAPSAVDNTAEITARQAIEGGTGLYEDLFDAGDITDPDTLEELAQQLLARFSEMGKEISVSSYKYGWEPGQDVPVELVTRGITATNYVVESVTKEEISKTLLKYTLRISNRVQQRDALAAFDRMIKRMRRPAKQVNTNIQFELAKTLPGIVNPGLVTGTGLTNTYVVRHSITLKNIALYFKTPPTGADIIIDIKRNGVTIFPAGFVCSYPVGNSGVVTYTQFDDAPLTLVKDDLVTIDVTQVGSTQPGKDGTITLNGWA